MDYDIEIFDDPNEMKETLRKTNTNNKSRMIAGYCYPWNSQNDKTQFDIILENGFKAQWNFSTDGFAIDPNSFEQVGCIHSTQGLEFDYVGIIIGLDLRYEKGHVITDRFKRAKSDASIKGLKNNEELGDRIIRNTYKTLLSRGQKGCYIYCEDKALAIIDLDRLRFEYSLSDEMIKNLEIINSNVTKVITVENLTSFYSLNDKDAVIIYLAGYHNHTKQALLMKIYSRYPDAEYLHFGDIDAGGFWIYHILKEKTNIPFVPYRMNVSELIENRSSLKKLSDNDTKRLNKMLSDNRFDIFKDTIEYMLNNNVKLEQELLD